VWNKKLNDLRKKTELIELKNIDYKVINPILFEILRKEDLFLTQTDVYFAKCKKDWLAECIEISKNEKHEMINVSSDVNVLIRMYNQFGTIINIQYRLILFMTKNHQGSKCR
jgi:hypothetical protein